MTFDAFTAPFVNYFADFAADDAADLALPLNGETYWVFFVTQPCERAFRDLRGVYAVLVRRTAKGTPYVALLDEVTLTHLRREAQAEAELSEAMADYDAEFAALGLVVHQLAGVPRTTMASRRYGTSPQAGASYTKEELLEMGVKKLVIYAKRPTWEGIDKLLKERALGSRSEVVAELVREALERKTKAKKE